MRNRYISDVFFDDKGIQMTQANFDRMKTANTEYAPDFIYHSLAFTYPSIRCMLGEYSAQDATAKT